jgi:hypothetical protein
VRTQPYPAPLESGAVDHYHIWVDLKPGIKDLDLASSIEGLLDNLKGKGLLESWSLQRRKLGFGPDALGEWHVDIVCKDLAQLDAAFNHMTPRTGEMERLHAMVWSKVDNYKAGLYRDFPDANRAR